MNIAEAIKDFGFPIIAAMGMGYFIFFIWKWVTETINPVVGQTMGTLIKLVDRIRMLDKTKEFWTKVSQRNKRTL